MATLVAASVTLPADYKGKKNREDGLMPHFSIVGFSDLDLLDLFSGMAERGFGYDVRKNWHFCFKHFSLSLLWSRI